MNEININDEIKEITARFGKSLSKSIESILCTWFITRCDWWIRALPEVWIVTPTKEA